MKFILDVGSNHRNELALAIKQIEAAKECGAHVVKFQYYTHKDLYGYAGKLDFQLDKRWFNQLKNACDRAAIEFMCTAFSVDGYKEVDPFVAMHKVASSDCRDPYILRYLMSTKKPCLISTGGKTELQIKEIMEFVDTKNDWRYEFLECVGLYPAALEDYALRDYTKWPWVGISDHTITPELAFMSRAKGAEVFEKHFDCVKDKLTPTPDTCVSLSTHEMATYIQRIIDFVPREKINSQVRKAIERDFLYRYNKRAIAIKAIKLGDELKYGWNYAFHRVKEDDLLGEDPMRAKDWDGMKSNVAIEVGSPISGEYLVQLVPGTDQGVSGV